MTEHDTRDDAPDYDIAAIQAKWLPIWDELKPFSTSNADDKRPRKYILDMFPYPSGDLHMGHAEAYAFGDIVARYWRQRGFNVLHPIGWDSFGLPAENAAIQRGANPATWTYDNIAQQRESMRLYGVSFDWDRVLHTSDPEYYKWNQWLFLKMYEKGLAYRKDSWVNWDPIDQTVLANEQVLPDGTSERSGAIVVKKKLTQWYFKITDYADRLLDDLNQLEGAWPAKVLSMQRNWIGRSIGADVDFEIEGLGRSISVFTTRPDTLYGATFMVVAPDSELAAELVAGSTPEVQSAFVEYLAAAQAHTEIERQDADSREDGHPARAMGDQPGQLASEFRSGQPIMCSPTTATAPSWRCPHTTSATSILRASSTCPCASCSTRTRRSRVRSRCSSSTRTVSRSCRKTRRRSTRRDGNRPQRRRPHDQLGSARRAQQEQRDQADHRATRDRLARGRASQARSGCATG